MDDDHLAIRALLDVELDPVRALRVGELEGGERVLRSRPGRAAVGDDLPEVLGIDAAHEGVGADGHDADASGGGPEQRLAGDLEHGPLAQGAGLGDRRAQLARAGQVAVGAHGSQRDEGGRHDAQDQARRDGQEQDDGELEGDEREVRVEVGDQELAREPDQVGRRRGDAPHRRDPGDEREDDLPAVGCRGPGALAQGGGAPGPLEEEHRQHEQPVRGQAQQQDPVGREDQPHEHDRGPELRRTVREVVVDVVLAQEREVHGTERRQERGGEEQQAHDHVRRHALESPRPAQDVEQRVQVGHAAILAGAEADDHQQAHAGEEDPERHGTHDHERRQADGVDHEHGDVRVRQHLVLGVQQEQSEQHADQGRDQHEHDHPREEIGDDELGPGAAEVAERADQRELCGRVARVATPGTRRPGEGSLPS